MAIEACLSRLRTEGKIDKRTADQALALHQGVLGDLLQHMPPASAEAKAAIETARAMEEAAKAKRLSVAKQAIAENEIMKRVQQHPAGPAAGLLSTLERDIWEKGGTNVGTATILVKRELDQRFQVGMEAFQSRLAGFVRDSKGLRDMIKELYAAGSSGNEVARKAAEGWARAVGYGFERAKAAGKMVSELKDWRIFQHHDTERIRKFGQTYWTAKVNKAVDAGSLDIMDVTTGAPATPLRRPAILQKAFEDIAVERGTGSGGGAISSEMRVFKFKTADAWLDYNSEFGVGDGGVFDAMGDHLNSVAREIALTETLGPDHAATMAKVLQEVRKAESLDSFTAKMKRDGFMSAVGKWVRTPIESAWSADATYRVLTGQVSAVQSRTLARIFGGMRSAKGGAVLGSAIGTAVPGDSATALLTARFNGIPATAVISRAMRLLREDAAGRELSANARLNAFGAIDSALTGKRFADDMVGAGVIGRISATAIRLSGIQRWTEALKTAFEQEFSSHVASQFGKTLDQLDAPLRRFMDRRQIDAAAWDHIRSTPVLEAEGARYVDFGRIEDRKIGDNLLGGIIEERAFAVLEPDARVRAVMTGGLQAGTFWGEMARTTGAFKSFPITQLTTHVMRGAIQDTAAGKTAYLVQMGIYLTLAGAVGLQVKQLINGKSTRPMDNFTFWGQAMLTGGALGIWGDFLNGAVASGGQTPITALLGPQVDLLDQAARLASGRYRNAFEGGETSFLGEFVKDIPRDLPGASTWYLRLGLQRMVFDQLQILADPNYRDSFRRQTRRVEEQGQSFMWAPGDALPAS